MEEDRTTSAPAESATLSVEDGAKAIHAKLFGQPETAKPEARREPEPEPEDEADEPVYSGEDGDEPSATDEEAPDTDEAPEPVRYRLPDGTEATPEEIAEWKRGQLRQSDYTRKTQELAEQRRALEQRLGEIAQRSQAFEENINFAIQVAEAYMPQPPDPSMLDSDPIGYLQAKEAYDAKAHELRSLYHQRQQHQEVQTREQMQTFEQMKAQEAQALLEKMPHLKDKSRLEQFQKDIVETLPNYGFKPEDLMSVYDHRIVRVIADAVAYRKLMSKRPQVDKKVETAAPVVPSGKRGSPAETKARALKDAKDRLRRDGSLEAGAEAIRLKLFGR